VTRVVAIVSRMMTSVMAMSHNPIIPMNDDQCNGDEPQPDY
jgi:hypothetical protein